MRLIFLGPPGAGKGTLAKMASEQLKIAHISTGDLFRDAIKQKTNLGLKVQAILAKGDLVPDELTIQLVADRLKEPDCANGFILDGFPRTIPQAEALQSIAPPEQVINFKLSEEKIIKRLSGRRVCSKCGAIFHVVSMPPKKEGICDFCSSPLIIRKDDEIEAIKNRLSVYVKQTAPLVEYYQQKGLLKDIDASSSPEEVLATFLALVGGTGTSS
jgi:adenylate kinase